MLRAAAYACRSGGHILVSLPPIGTNSHVADDRVQLFRLFAKLSLNLLSIVPDVIYYDTPYFEANALAAAGYPNIPKTWRRGDLFVLKGAQRGRLRSGVLSTATQLARGGHRPHAPLHH